MDTIHIMRAWLSRHLVPCVFVLSYLAVIIIWWLNYWTVDITEDANRYAILGKLAWENHFYSMDGITLHAQHLPFFSLISYPFTALLQPHAGMKVLSLGTGLLLIFAVYQFLSRFFPRDVALAVVPLMALHHPFNFLVASANVDLMYAALFYISALALHRSLTESPRWFIPAGILLGITCLTRYNAITLFPFALGASLYYYKGRPPWQMFAGLGLGTALFCLWLLRNYVHFGSLFYSDYVGQLSDSLLVEFFQNIWHYGNPMSNILPVLFVCMLIGLVRHARGRLFLIWLLAAGVALSSIWTAKSARLMMPAYPIMFAFAVWGAYDLVGAISPIYRKWAGAVLGVGVVLSQIGMLCLYSIASCHAWFDQQIGLIPPNLSLAIETRYSVYETKQFINQQAETGAQILVDALREAYVFSSDGIFRSDLIVSDVPETACPMYSIGSLYQSGTVVFESVNRPAATVRKIECAGSAVR